MERLDLVNKIVASLEHGMVWIFNLLDVNVVLEGVNPDDDFEFEIIGEPFVNQYNLVGIDYKVLYDEEIIYNFRNTVAESYFEIDEDLSELETTQQIGDYVHGLIDSFNDDEVMEFIRQGIENRIQQKYYM